MLRVIHFEIPIENPDQTVPFYRDLFGWDIQKWDGPVDYWLVNTADKGEVGIDGALMRRGGTATSTVNTIEVPSIDEYMEKVEESGGTVVSAKQTVPGVGYHAYCKDPDGNLFGIMEVDHSAA